VQDAASEPRPSAGGGYTRSQLAGIFTSALVGSIAGGLALGWYADHFGRRRGLAVSIVLYSLGALLSAFSWNYGSLLAFRLITAVGLGGEFGLGMSLLNEAWTGRRRGLGAGIIQASFVAGIAIAGWVAPLVLGAFGDNGWRAWACSLFWGYYLWYAGTAAGAYLGAWLSEIFPVGIRATCVSSTYMFGRGASGLAPIFGPGLVSLGVFGGTLAIGRSAGVLSIIGVAVMVVAGIAMPKPVLLDASLIDPADRPVGFGGVSPETEPGPMVLVEDRGDQFPPRAHADLREDHLEVVLHGVRRKMNLGGDLPGGQALEDQARHTRLTRRQAVGADDEWRDLRRLGFLDDHGRVRGLRAGVDGAGRMYHQPPARGPADPGPGQPVVGGAVVMELPDVSDD
jgi:hypothetical protein